MVIGYVRGSIQEQVDIQTDKVKQYCNTHGIICDKIISEVGTGTSLKREGLIKTLIEASRGDKARIIAVSPDRISRSSEDFYQIEAALKKAGIVLKFINSCDGIQFDNIPDPDKEMLGLKLGKEYLENNGLKIRRIKYGEECKYSNEDSWSAAICPTCGVKKGQLHLLGCNYEMCPICHFSLVKCECFGLNTC